MNAPASNPLRVDKAIHDELNKAFAGIDPEPPRERSWDCLAGEGPAVCSHAQITQSTSAGRTEVVCECGHSWVEAHE
jgi:hypothetical protein